MSRLREFTGARPFLAHVSTLLSGTVVAQLIVLATTPITARLYSPEAIGSFAALLAIAQVVSAVAAARYDMAIVLPDEDDEARRLTRLSLVLAACAAAATSLVSVLFASPIARALHHPELAGYLGWTGVIVAATSMVTTMGYWFTRRTRFSAIASNRVTQAAAIEGTRIGAPLAGLSPIGGQVASQLFGQVLAATTLLVTGRDALRTPASGRSARELMRLYARMPLLNAPNALVDAVRINGIVVLIGVYYSANPQGQFSKAWLLMQAPVVLITAAVSQVQFQRFARAERGRMRAMVARSIRLSLIAGFIPFTILFVIAPALLPWYLGPGWEASGQIGRALVPWLLLNVVTSPISTVFVVADRQSLMLGFALVYAAAPLALIAFLGARGTPIVSTVWWVSAVMTALLAGLTVLTMRVAARWDEKADA